MASPKNCVKKRPAGVSENGKSLGNVRFPEAVLPPRWVRGGGRGGNSGEGRFPDGMLLPEVLVNSAVAEADDGIDDVDSTEDDDDVE